MGQSFVADEEVGHPHRPSEGMWKDGAYRPRANKLCSPPQPSWHVQCLLFSLCQEVNRVGGHTLPKVTLQELLRSCLAEVLAAYEKLVEQKQEKVPGCGMGAWLGMQGHSQLLEQKTPVHDSWTGDTLTLTLPPPKLRQKGSRHQISHSGCALGLVFSNIPPWAASPVPGRSPIPACPVCRGRTASP